MRARCQFAIRVLQLLPLLAVLVVLLSGQASLRVSGAEALSVRADAWMPFNGDPRAEMPGYVVEVLRAIFDEEGVHVDYQTSSWDDALVAVREGKIGAVIGSDRRESAGLIVPKESIGVSRTALWARKSSTWTYQNLGSLAHLKLGAISCYQYWESLDTYIATRKDKGIVMMSGETPLVDGIEKLNSGEIDVLVESVPVFVWTVQAHGYSVDDYRIVFSEMSVPIYVAFFECEAGRGYAQQFDAGIRRLRSSGQLATILKRYGLNDWK